MMRALIAGGLDAAWSDVRNQMANSHADKHYHPNRDGLYEVALKEYADLDFPLKYQGKLIKVMLWGLDHLAVNPDGYRVVIMRRDLEEIRQSYEAFFGHPLRASWLGEYRERIQRAQRMLHNRSDVYSTTVLNYRDLIDNPRSTFNELYDLIEFDIDKAATTIDPSLYRFRREKLTVGI